MSRIVLFIGVGFLWGRVPVRKLFAANTATNHNNRRRSPQRDMLVAAILVHVHSGFFMNWLGKQKGEGVEYGLLLWAIALALILQGAGAFSPDRVISAKFETAKLEN